MKKKVKVLKKSAYNKLRLAVVASEDGSSFHLALQGLSGKTGRWRSVRVFDTVFYRNPEQAVHCAITEVGGDMLPLLDIVQID